MVKHKHEVTQSRSLGDQIIEICSCGKRRVVTVAFGYRRRDRVSRWVSEEEADKYMLSWLWRY
jgi:hypothetical protein